MVWSKLRPTHPKRGRYRKSLREFVSAHHRAPAPLFNSTGQLTITVRGCPVCCCGIARTRKRWPSGRNVVNSPAFVTVPETPPASRVARNYGIGSSCLNVARNSGIGSSCLNADVKAF